MIEFVPLLHTQDSLYDIPRGPARFGEYRNIMQPAEGEVPAPVSAFNPMGKEHAPSAVKRLLKMDVEPAVHQGALELSDTFSFIAKDYKVALVVADDCEGQWTNRSMVELGRLTIRPQGKLTAPWISALSWASDRPSLEEVLAEVRYAVYLALFMDSVAVPTNLAEIMNLAGLASVFAGRTYSGDEAVDRDTIEILSESNSVSEQYAYLFGDVAAQEMGFEPVGIGENGGLVQARA